MKPQKIQSMKSLATIAFIGTLLNAQFKVLPNIDLLIVMCISIAIDFGTGVLKAVMLGTARNSKGYRKTVVKFAQYVGATVVGMMLKYLSMQQSDMAKVGPYVDYLTNGLVIFIIFIEVTSVLENLYAIDKETPFSKYFVGPLLKLLTFQIKNNPIEKLANQQDKQPTQ